MQSYLTLINDLLPGSPKEQYERLVALEAQSVENYSRAYAFRTFLVGLRDTPDTAQVGHIRSTIDALLQVHFPDVIMPAVPSPPLRPKKLTKEFLADVLNGNEYCDEISKEWEAKAEAAGLVVCFGYSDDNIEFRGAIYEEVGCFIPDGTKSRDIYFTKDGTFPDLEEMVSDGKEPDMSKYACVTAHWCPKDYHGRVECSWKITTPLPFASFNVMDDGEVYCIGCVFDLNDF